MSIEIILAPCDTGYRYTFPAMTAELDEENMALVTGLRKALEGFGALLAEQQGCSGVRINGITFSKLLPQRSG